MSVQLIIKSSSQNVEDFKLTCELTCTIGEVKDQITSLYPTKPLKEHQKLIYGGKLLPDHLSLKSILNPMQERHTVHLVCPYPTKTDTEKSSDTKEKPAVLPTTFTAVPPNPEYTQVNPQIPMSQYLGSGISSMSVVTSSQDAVHQYLAMQQMYTQFMTQYLSQYNGLASGIPYVPVTPPVQPSPPPAPQQNAAPHVPRRQAEEEEHDYIDYLYVISRAVMLFAILYYYSSVTRIAVVILMILFMAFYAKFSRQHQVEEIQQRANERQMTEAETTQEAPTDIQTLGTGEPAPENSAEPILVQPREESRSLVSTASTIVGLVSAFFTSLVPVEPVPVN